MDTSDSIYKGAHRIVIERDTGYKEQKYMLSLIDVAMTLGENEYALSLGQCGIGFYLWDGKPLCAKNVYLHLSNPQHVKAFTFSLMTEYNDVRNMTMTFDPESSFQLSGFCYLKLGEFVANNRLTLVTEKH